MGILDIFTQSDTNLLSALSKDHDRLKELLEQILDDDSKENRPALFAEFKTLLATHAKAEEKVLYRRMEKLAENRPDALEGFVEHEVAASLLTQLAAARQKFNEKWIARCTVLKELLEHHIKEEESDIFSDARRQFTSEQLEKLGTEFLREKTRLGMPAELELEQGVPIGVAH